MDIQTPRAPATDSTARARLWDSNATRLFLCGLSALFWELALIRWLGATIRIVAYFSNVVLISAFFGLGVGALLTRFRFRLERLLVPLLTLAVLLGAGFDGLWHANPLASEFFWIGAPAGVFKKASGVQFLSTGIILALVYIINAACFMAFGQYMGRLFKNHLPLKAYSIEILGSLVGIVLYSLLSRSQIGPTAWFLLGFVFILLMIPWRRFDLAVTLGLATLIAFVVHVQTKEQIWSPYYRIQVEPITKITDLTTHEAVTFPAPIGNVLAVNNDYHQMMLDLRERPIEHAFLKGWRGFYDAPYTDHAGLAPLPPGKILVVGAGTGNDVAAALRRTDRLITAVEIDPGIADLGRHLHAEKPYGSPRVTLVTDDARSFFHNAPSGEYAAVVFGFLDSHRLLSAFSSVRLDNFIYTMESMSEVHRLLIPGGRVALSFATNTDWIHTRLMALVTSATGQDVQLIADPEHYANGVLYLGQRGTKAFAPNTIVAGQEQLLPTDDWPFLYLKAPAIPGHNLALLIFALVLSLAALLLLPRGERRLRLPYLLLGMAFFLVETSNVIRMALLFGSTWWVNTVVFAGVLALVLLANLTTRAWRVPLSLGAVLLSGTILLSAFLPSDWLLGLTPFWRVLAAVAVHLGPVYFGGLIFARLIEHEPCFYQAYGSNVIGAVLGGALEYVSIVFGFHFLLALALACYLIVFLGLFRGRSLTA